MTEAQIRLKGALGCPLSVETIELLIVSAMDVLDETNAAIDRSMVLDLLEREKRNRYLAEIEANLVKDYLEKIERYLLLYLNTAIVQTIEEDGSFALPEDLNTTAFSNSVMEDLGILVMNSFPIDDEHLQARLIVINDLGVRLNEAGIQSTDLIVSFIVRPGSESLSIRDVSKIEDCNPQVRIYPKQRLQSGPLIDIVDHLNNNPNMLVTQHILEYSKLYDR